MASKIGSTRPLPKEVQGWSDEKRYQFAEESGRQMNTGLSEDESDRIAMGRLNVKND